MAHRDGRDFALSPEIADLLTSGEPEVSEPIVVQANRLAAEVAEAHRDRAVRQLLAVHAHVANGVRAHGLLAEGILVDGDHLVVGEEAQGERIELLHVAPDQERCGEETP